MFGKIIKTIIAMIPAGAPQRWEWIENYIDGKLSPPDMQEVDAEIAANAAFGEEVDRVKYAWKLVSDARTGLVVRDTLTTLRNSGRVVPLRKPQWPIWIPSGIVAACVIFIVFLATSSVELPKPDYDIAVLRSLDPIELDGAQRKIYETFFEGQARLTEGKYSEAVKPFRRIAAIKGLRPYFTEAAEWHLCVALFKAGEHREAGEILKKINSRKKSNYIVNRMERWKMWVQIHLRS